MTDERCKLVCELERMRRSPEEDGKGFNKGSYGLLI
jgi:hypothetical protein